MAECLQVGFECGDTEMGDTEDHAYSSSNAASSAKPTLKVSVLKPESYKQIIPKECVLLIIKLYKEHFVDLNGPNKRFEKRTAWSKIANIVQEHGYQVVNWMVVVLRAP
jgi:hypothetical protein